MTYQHLTLRIFESEKKPKEWLIKKLRATETALETAAVMLLVKASWSLAAAIFK